MEAARAATLALLKLDDTATDNQLRAAYLRLIQSKCGCTASALGPGSCWPASCNGAGRLAAYPQSHHHVAPYRSSHTVCRGTRWADLYYACLDNYLASDHDDDTDEYDEDDDYDEYEDSKDSEDGNRQRDSGMRSDTGGAGYTEGFFDGDVMRYADFLTV